MRIKSYGLGSLNTNCHVLINDNNDAICFDIGGDSGFLKIKEIQENFKIKAVFLTHGHFDHIGGVKDFCMDKIPVYIGEDELEFINDGNLNLSSMFGEKVEPFKAISVKDNDIIKVCGFEIQVIKTAGHTKGGVSYKVGDNLFCGDTLFKGSFGRIDFPTGNAKELISSCKKLFTFENCTLYCGHGESTTILEEKERNPINYYD